MTHAGSMHASASKSPSVVAAATQYWRDLRARSNSRAATTGLIQAVWSFVRNSTPERQRRLYGDFDFDWEHRVNTMSGGVGWRERLLGELHSLYQPTEPAAFHEMMQTLRDIAHLDFSEFVFLDLGSGKGRTLMMASDYPFQRIIAAARDADSIATAGRTGLSHLLIGSVAEKVVRHAPVPVLTIHPPAKRRTSTRRARAARRAARRR